MAKQGGKFHLFLLIVFLLVACAGCAERIQAAAVPQPAIILITLAPPAPTVTLTRAPASSPTPRPSPTRTATSRPTPTATPVLLAGAGDIAYCGVEYQGDDQTAALIAAIPGARVFTAGDHAYGRGTREEFLKCYDPSWGQFKDRTRPSVGNHDYETENGAPYFEYFGSSAGDPRLGYYSYDLGDWHIVALNSNCDIVGCGKDSPQAAWLLNDLADSARKCTMLYWHHPRFSSGKAGNYESMSTLWHIATLKGAEFVVSGHEHDYERFAPQDANGDPDPYGLRQFVVGTGGANLRAFNEIKPNSQVRYNQAHGIILFHLYPGRYEWEFISTSGGFRDSGSAKCY